MSRFAFVIIFALTSLYPSVSRADQVGYSHECDDYCPPEYSGTECAAIHGGHVSQGLCANFYTDRTGYLVVGYGFCRTSQEAGHNRPAWSVDLTNNQNGVWVSGTLSCGGHQFPYSVSCSGTAEHPALGYGGSNRAGCGTGGGGSTDVRCGGSGLTVTTCPDSKAPCSLYAVLVPID